MAQHDYNIANQGFSSFRSDLNNALSAIQTTNSGTSLPTGAVAGQMWLDTTNATTPTLKFYDGTDSISLAIINYTSNTVDWLDSTTSSWSSKSSNFNASAGNSYYVNTTSGAVTATLPASPSQNDEIRFLDVAGTFDTNNLTVARNANKIQGSSTDLIIATERAGFSLVYYDATQGWLIKDK
jgi:hypothetical protein